MPGTCFEEVEEDALLELPLRGGGGVRRPPPPAWMDSVEELELELELELLVAGRLHPLLLPLSVHELQEISGRLVLYESLTSR